MKGPYSTVWLGDEAHNLACEAHNLAVCPGGRADGEAATDGRRAEEEEAQDAPPPLGGGRDAPGAPSKSANVRQSGPDSR